MTDESTPDLDETLRNWFGDAGLAVGTASQEGSPEFEREQAAETIRAWTRQRFGLGAQDDVFVSETASGLPGLPPLETIVSFWSDEKRHHFKIF